MTRAEAVAVLDRFPWAVPTSTISNFISGRRVEIDLGDLSDPEQVKRPAIGTLSCLRNDPAPLIFSDDQLMRGKGSMSNTSLRLCFILNGKSGSCDPDTVSEAIERIAADHGADAQIHVVPEGRDIAHLVRTARMEGAKIVVGGGGDGTINAVASELMGSDVPLGILPLGTLNHFAKTLKVPLSLEEAITNVFKGETRDVDVGEVNGHVFLNNSGIGLYPHIVVDREASEKRGHAKWFALLWAATTKLKNYNLMHVVLRTDSGEQVVRATPFLFIGNNKYETSGLGIGSRPRLDAGRLWIALAPEAGRLKLLVLAIWAVIGRVKGRHLEVLEAADLEVRTRQRRLEVAMDGEVTVLDSPLRYRSLPKALRVIVPTA